MRMSIYELKIETSVQLNRMKRNVWKAVSDQRRDEKGCPPNMEGQPKNGEVV
jgi:hypothetical protein